MPTWHDPPEKTINDISNVLDELNAEVSTMPAFETVTGVPLEQLVEHATSVIASYLLATEDDDRPSPTDPITWVRVYCMAFVVGMKYGESRAETSHGIA